MLRYQMFVCDGLWNSAAFKHDVQRTAWNEIDAPTTFVRAVMSTEPEGAWLKQETPVALLHFLFAFRASALSRDSARSGTDLT